MSKKVHAFKFQTQYAHWEIELNDDAGTIVVKSHQPKPPQEIADGVEADRRALHERIAQRTAGNPGLLSKAAAWMKAEASLRMSGPLPDDQYALRIKACTACPELDAVADPQVGWCKKCGCGRNARAELTIKARMPAATCPLNKWPTVDERPQGDTIPPSGAAP
jgi:hypothetical protein